MQTGKDAAKRYSDGRRVEDRRLAGKVPADIKGSPSIHHSFPAKQRMQRTAIEDAWWR